MRRILARQLPLFLSGTLVLVANLFWVRPGQQYIGGLAGILVCGVAVYVYRRARPLTRVAGAKLAPAWLWLVVMITVTVSAALIHDALSSSRSEGWLVLDIWLGVQAASVAEQWWRATHPASAVPAPS